MVVDKLLNLADPPQREAVRGDPTEYGYGHPNQNAAPVKV